jgi:hypothetical protein
MAGGLLIVAMLASITGAIGLAAIGAEQDLTGNLVPAVMFLAVAASVSLVTVLGAFEVLAAIYLPKSTTLFAVITGVAGLAGTFFTSLSIADSWHTGPRDPVRKRAWQATQWIKSQQQADRQTLIAVGVSAIPASIGIALRIAGFHITPSTATVTWLVSSSLVLAMGAVAIAGLRTRHPADGVQKGLRVWEAYGTALAIGAYTFVLMLLLPAGPTRAAHPRITPHPVSRSVPVDVQSVFQGALVSVQVPGHLRDRLEVLWNQPDRALSEVQIELPADRAAQCVLRGTADARPGAH